MERAGFCRLMQLGLLRLLTTAPAMGRRPLSNTEAWAVCEAQFADSRVRLFPELPAIEDAFRALSNVPQPASKLWVDAYLAAHAAANEATLVTFDQSFANYVGFDCRYPAGSVVTASAISP